MSTPAALLNGKSLANGWDVIGMITKSAVGTGGHFSVSYKVKHAQSGKEAFLKALDFSGALQSSDQLRHLQAMLEAYNFERDLLEKCKNNRLDRIATPIDHGAVQIPGYGNYSSVHYLIFELAEGDIRNYSSNLTEFDLAWCLRSLHHIAVGMKQLHWNGIVHQDLKPSNILVMGHTDTKISDLGRASDQGQKSLNDQMAFAGDRRYAPFDIYYGDSGVSGFEQKFLSDVYLFGSLIFFFFTNVNATQAINSKLDVSQIGMQGQVSFKAILPYLQEAFKAALNDLKVEIKKIAPDYADDLVELAQQLCEPDPTVRGDPKWRNTVVPNYDLQRIISRLDILAKSVRKVK